MGASNERETDGEAARRRLLALLADAAVSAASTGLLAGLDRDRAGSGGSGAHPVPEPPSAVTRCPTADPTADPLSFIRRVCALAVAEVGVDGAGVTVMGSVAGGIAGHRDQVESTDAVSRELEDLQLTAGQGPCLDALAAGAPVLIDDLSREAPRWPGFAPGAVAAGARAVFSLPLQVGAVQLGTLDLHRGSTGPLAPDQLSAALVLADLITESMLDETHPHPTHADADVDRGLLPEVGWLRDAHADVHVASGMTSVSLRVGVGEALVRLRAYAYAHDEPIGEVASQIITRRLRLTDDGDS